MGAWGSGPFENDDAADWVLAAIESTSVTEVAAALEIVAEMDGRSVGMKAGRSAVAAAEVVSAARGYPCRGFPNELKTWISAHAIYANRTLTSTAKAAIRNVVAGSEVAELWEDEPGWKRRMNNLAERLARPSKAKRQKMRKASTPRPEATVSKDVTTLLKDLRKLGATVYKLPDGSIEGVDLSDSRVTAANIPLIAEISSLRYLAIYFDAFGDSDLKQLARLKNLQELLIEGCENVTDQGLEHIAKLSRLTKLDVSDCGRVTDAGLRHLAKLSGLTSLIVRRTGVTKAGITAFRKAVPNCEVAD